MTNLSLIKPTRALATNVEAFATTRRDGSSQGNFSTLNLAQHVEDESAIVARNRKTLSDAFSNKLSFQWLDQSHSNVVHLVEEPGDVLAGDALVTREPGVACCVLTADCLPIILASKFGDEVAIVHAGWRGLLNGIIPNTVNAMDSASDALVAWLGPAIGPCHYEVGEDLRQRYLECASTEAEKRDAEIFFSRSDKPGKYMLDLYELAVAQLTSQSICCLDEKRYCTYCEDELFYSYRRSKQTGRMASIVYIEPQSET